MARKILMVALALMLFLSVSPVFATTVKLQTADVDNLGDTYISEASASTNYGTDATPLVQGNAGSQKFDMLKFNISSILSGQTIADAQFCYYLNTNPLVNSVGYLITAYHLFQNYTCGGIQWNESCPTWNLRPNSTLSQYNTTGMQSLNITGLNATGWYCWNVTPAVLRSYSMGFMNASIYLTANISLGSPTSSLTFRSKEHATTSTRPYLNITYFDYSPPQWSSNSTNTTGIGGEPVMHSTFWTDNVALSKFIFSTNITGSWVNDTASSFSNGWVNVTKTAPSQGVVGWQVFANDTSGNWNSTPVFAYVVYPVNLTAEYPSGINTTGNYSVIAHYLYNGTPIHNATMTICYTFTATECSNMTDGADYYYWNFTYDHSVGGIIQFNITATGMYPTHYLTFYITFFNKEYNVRFWKDLNKTDPYINEFLWVYVKPHCDFYDQSAYLGLYNACNVSAYHAMYSGGTAVLNIWTPNVYDFYLVDGSVDWNCTSCEPVVTKFSLWTKFDMITVTDATNQTVDYFWNTSAYGNTPLFGNYDWNFWSSVAGIIILFIVVVAVAYLTDSGIAVFLAMILMYMLLKLFGILTGAIFFGLF